jgi:hypothetical protein
MLGAPLLDVFRAEVLVQTVTAMDKDHLGLQALTPLGWMSSSLAGYLVDL